MIRLLVERNGVIAARSVRSLSPLGERVGVRGLPARRFGTRYRILLARNKGYSFVAQFGVMLLASIGALTAVLKLA
jgi:hypothetical protein